MLNSFSLCILFMYVNNEKYLRARARSRSHAVAMPYVFSNRFQWFPKQNQRLTLSLLFFVFFRPNISSTFPYWLNIDFSRARRPNGRPVPPRPLNTVALALYCCWSAFSPRLRGVPVKTLVIDKRWWVCECHDAM